jgi:hypothetical protein
MATCCGPTFQRCVLPPSSALMIQAVYTSETLRHLESYTAPHPRRLLYSRADRIWVILPTIHFRMFCLPACYLRKVWNKIIISLIVVYECKTWSLTLRKEHRLGDGLRIVCWEICSWVVDTPASYLRSPGFKSRPRDRLSSLRFCMVFLSPFPIHHSLITLSFSTT